MSERPVPESCRLCGAALSSPEIVGPTVFGGRDDQAFWECPACGVVFLYPPLTEQEEAAFYAKEFERFMQRRSGGDFDWSGPEAHIRTNRPQYERRLRVLEPLLAPGARVLEVGCSSGFMLLPLRERGLVVTGVEPSEGFTDFLTARGVEVHPSLEGMRDSLAGDARFDIIMHFFVLEHVRDPVAFTSELMELVARGGRLIFEVPSRDDPLLTIYGIPAFQEFYWSVAHNYYFDRHSLEWVLDRVGMPYEIVPEQRYDLSNHMTWALEGRPGGQGRWSASFTADLQRAYRESMITTGHTDSLFAVVTKGG